MKYLILGVVGLILLTGVYFFIDSQTDVIESIEDIDYSHDEIDEDSPTSQSVTPAKGNSYVSEQGSEVSDTDTSDAVATSLSDVDSSATNITDDTELSSVGAPSEKSYSAVPAELEIIETTLDAPDTEDDTESESLTWKRNPQNPVYRDYVPASNYGIASDPHVFFDEDGTLKMIYTGDDNGNSSIRLASGSSWNNWTVEKSLLNKTGPSGLDSQKETPFYRKSSTGKHQIYYIGYDDEDTYQSQIYLAEADILTGPYTQMSEPVVPRGMIAGENVYAITSPSVVEHQGLLYITFIGWDAAPEDVTEVWIMGATSADEGHTWSDFQIVDTKIGMEGQVTKVADNYFVAVRTSDYGDKEAIFYATAPAPFGPWAEEDEPLLIQAGAPYETDEIIAPQITIDPATGEEYLFYTGADHQIGWWVMLAEQE